MLNLLKLLLKEEASDRPYVREIFKEEIMVNFVKSLLDKDMKTSIELKDF